MIGADIRKTRLGDLLRNTASAFVQETAASSVEDTRLRSEIDCLLSLWVSGEISPVAEFMDRAATRRALSQSPPSPLSPSSTEEVPLR